jgi:uncharacterized protein (TIGR01244 family)
MPALFVAFVAIAPLTAAPAGAQQVTKETVPGIVNFARVETTVACGGAIKPEGVAEIKQRGFKAIFDLQLPDERTANIDGEAMAAKAAGVNFIHVPFTPAAPDTSSVDKFLTEIRKPENDPAFIHCGGGNRAAGFWFIKRVVVDKWDSDRALKEAEALGLATAPDAPMRKFVLEYVQTHKQAG